MVKLGWLFLAGGAGTLMRYVLTGVVFQALGARFPYGTLIVNLAGCLIIGFLFALTDSKLALSPDTRLYLMVGLLGAFTTFSTFILETFALMKDGEFFLSAVNVLGSVLLGLAVLYLGILLGEAL
ncbi:MAG: fluoride efflux transporter CrcB [Candidatus Omnitrophota bacterium]